MSIRDYTMPGDAGWIGVDFDGTLAEYHGWKGPTELGDPIPAMLARVKRWLAEGREVKVFTARAWAPDFPSIHDQDFAAKIAWRGDSFASVAAVRRWCVEHLGCELAVTCVKDLRMTELYDDRAVQVEANTGRIIGHSRRGLLGEEVPA